MVSLFMCNWFIFTFEIFILCVRFWLYICGVQSIPVCFALYHICIQALVLMFECPFQLFEKVNSFIISQNLLGLWNGLSVLCIHSPDHFYSPPVNLFKFVAYKFFSLSFWSLVHSYSRWSTVCFPPSHGHSADSTILDPCKYALVLPWAVMIDVKFGVNLILVVSVSLMIGKNCFVFKRFVVLYNFICHLLCSGL